MKSKKGENRAKYTHRERPVELNYINGSQGMRSVRSIQFRNAGLDGVTTQTTTSA